MSLEPGAMGPGLVISADLAQARTGAKRAREAGPRGPREADVPGARVAKAAAHAGTGRRGQPRAVVRVPEKQLVGGGLSPGQDRVARDQSPGERRGARGPGRKEH
jgi:hypothetical protein